MVAAVSAGQMGITVGAGLAAALIVVAALIAVGARTHVRFRPWATGIGAACIGLLIGLSVADLVIGGLGQWWANRPVAAATVTGLLLLAVTVLVVQSLLENLEMRRFAPGGRAAVREILDMADGKGDPDQVLAGVYGTLAAARAAGEPPGESFPYEYGSGHSEKGAYESFEMIVLRAQNAHELIKRAITEQAPVLTATETLNDLYNVALNSANDVGDLAKQLETYNSMMSEEADAAREDDPDRDYDLWRPKGPAVRRCWFSVIGAWNNVVVGLYKLEECASREIPGFDNHQKPAWRQEFPGPGYALPSKELVEFPKPCQAAYRHL